MRSSDLYLLYKQAYQLTARGRKHIKPSNFALPGRRFPIHDLSHARNALARAKQMLDRHRLSPSEYLTIVRKVHSKYPSIGKSS